MLNGTCFDSSLGVQNCDMIDSLQSKLQQQEFNNISITSSQTIKFEKWAPGPFIPAVAFICKIDEQTVSYKLTAKS